MLSADHEFYASYILRRDYVLDFYYLDLVVRSTELHNGRFSLSRLPNAITMMLMITHLTNPLHIRV